MPYEKLRLMVAPLSGDVYLGTARNDHTMSDNRRKFTKETLQANAEYWRQRLAMDPTAHCLGKSYDTLDESDTKLVILATRLTATDTDKLFNFAADLVKAHQNEGA